MPKSPHKYAMYIDDTKTYLNGVGTAELAKSRGVHQSTMSIRITQTIHKLINYYNLKNSESEVRFFHNIRGLTKVKNISDNADYWLKLISDYEKGVPPIIPEPKPIVEEIKKEPEPLPERPKRIKLSEILAMS